MDNFTRARYHRTSQVAAEMRVRLNFINIFVKLLIKQPSNDTRKWVFERVSEVSHDW